LGGKKKKFTDLGCWRTTELPYDYLTAGDIVLRFCRRAAYLQEIRFSAAVSTFSLEVKILVSFFFQHLQGDHIMDKWIL